MPEINALLGIQQMKKANKILHDRRAQAKLYDKLLEDTPNLKLLKIPEKIKSSYYKYIVFVNSKIRDRIKKKMQKSFGVTLPGEVYNQLCHSQPVIKKNRNIVMKIGNQFFKNSKKIAAEQLCLPLYPGLKNSEIKYVVQSLKKTLNEFV